MGLCGPKRNFMDELYNIICEIDRLKPEPEVCNVRCPPLGCPRGLCPGMCCSEGICDPCCLSQMPCQPPLSHPPRCCAPPCSTLKKLAHSINCRSSQSCNSPSNGQNRQKTGCSISCHNSSADLLPTFCPSPCGPPPLCTTPCTGAILCRSPF